MSRNLFSILSSFKLKWNNYYFIGLPLHSSYSYFTQKNRNIEISEKYTFDSNGFTNFMIVDTENKHYKIGNNLWFWKWDSIEDWTSVKKGNVIPISYYGFRVPFLGIFPNVVNINDINDINDINSVLIKSNTSISNSDSGLTNSIVTANVLSTAILCAK